MANRIQAIKTPVVKPGQRGGEPQSIGDILAALLDHYHVRFPNVQIGVVETRGATGSASPDYSRKVGQGRATLWWGSQTDETLLRTR
ncbi:MAG: hypothetical protein ABSG68_10295 [Thermoguttaceae bacterium]|jgi:hypothetical protein